MSQGSTASGHRLTGVVKMADTAALADLWAYGLHRRMLFLATGAPPPLGSTFELQLELPGHRLEMTVAVRFVGDARSARGAGCGIEIMEGKEALAQRVRAILGDLPPELAPQPGSPPRAAPALTFKDAPPPPSKAKGGAEQLRALVVEDDAELGKVYTKLLDAAGFAVTVCRDGAAAVEAAQKSSYAIYVVDYLLPKLDGLKVIEKLVAQQTGAPIVFASAVLRDPKVAGQLRAMGVKHVVEKPFRLEGLRRVFDDAIAIAQAQSHSQ